MISSFGKVMQLKQVVGFSFVCQRIKQSFLWLKCMLTDLILGKLDTLRRETNLLNLKILNSYKFEHMDRIFVL